MRQRVLYRCLSPENLVVWRGALNKLNGHRHVCLRKIVEPYIFTLMPAMLH